MTITVKVDILSRLDKVAWAEFDGDKRRALPIRKNKIGQEFVQIYGRPVELSAFGHIPQFKAPNQPELFQLQN